MDVFQQTISISIAGMGLTFAAIGLLVLAMMALTRWARGSEDVPPGKGEPGGAIPTDRRLEEEELAAAVAVGIALALAGRRAHPTHAWHSARPEDDPSAWQSYSREQQLDQRKTHQTLRW